MTIVGDDELARRAGIPVRVLRAIRLNESGGRPTRVRFEPHVFNRLTSNRFASQIPFTRDPARGVSLVGSETNRATFERASGFDRDAAIRATSWGLYQVLGGHLLRVASGDPVRYFDANPAQASAEMLVSWFESRPAAARAAQEGNIPELARLYNGSELWGRRVAAILASGRADGPSAPSPSGTLSVAKDVLRQASSSWVAPVVILGGAAALTASLLFIAWRNREAA